MNKTYEDILNKKSSELLNKKLQNYTIEDFMFAFFLQEETNKNIFKGFHGEDNEKTLTLLRNLNNDDTFTKYNIDNLELDKKEAETENKLFYFDSYFLSHCALNEKELNKKFMETFCKQGCVVKKDYSFGFFFLIINTKVLRKQLLLDEINKKQQEIEELKTQLNIQ